jgi:predicted nuclease with RNAse H fold
MQSASQEPILLGVDLAGPANPADTCMAWRSASGVIEGACGLSDAAIVDWVAAQKQTVWVLMDAPLSYQDGGGYRPCDARLRAFLNQQGFSRLGVMAPTFSKMVYLTLRGISLSARLRAMGAQVWETHPGASLLCAGMPPEAVYALKTSRSAIETILARWQAQGQGFAQVPADDHALMAIQALLTAERWRRGQAYWQCEDWVV